MISISRFRFFVFLVTTLLTLAGCTKIIKEPALSVVGNSVTSVSPEVSNPLQGKSLIKAIMSGDEALATILIKNGSNVDETIMIGGDQITPLLAAVAVNNKRITELLIRNNASNSPTFNGYSARDFLYYLHDEDNAALLPDKGTKKF